MKFNQLKYFLTVAEEGQITSAAEKLHMTQPPLSQQLKQLEDSLDIKLINRSSKGIELTPEGRLLYTRGTQIMTMIDNVQNELKDAGRGTLGTVHMGIISSAVGLLMNFDFMGFCADNPRINYNVIENDAFTLLDMLDSALIEVAFTRTPFPSQSYNVFPLFTEDVIAVASKNYHFCTSLYKQDTLQPIRLEQLVDENLVLLDNYENTVLTACKQQGVEPSVICRSSNAITALLCARAGLGIMVTPLNMLDMTDTADLLIWKIDCPSLVSSVCMVWKSEQTISAATQKFILHIKKHFVTPSI